MDEGMKKYYSNRVFVRWGVYKGYIHGYDTFCDRLEDDMALFVDLMAFYVMEDVS